jgi:molybdopterin converting factor small subunit
LFLHALRKNYLLVTVLLFSSYAEALGTGALRLEVPSGISAGDLLSRVRGLAQGQALPPALIAVNQEYAAPDLLISPQDEIALIPPVAGG